jgi:hypothetical protein
VKNGKGGEIPMSGLFLKNKIKLIKCFLGDMQLQD